jgi:MFS family permease
LSIAISFTFSLFSKEFRDVDQHKVRTGITLRESLQGLKNQGLLLVSIVRMLRMMITMRVVMTAFPIFLTDELSVTVTIIGVVMSLRTLAFILSTFSGGHVIERLGSKTTTIIGILIEASTLLLYPSVRELNLVFVLVFVGGFGSGLFQISLALLMSVQMEERFIGSGVGVYRTFQDTGSVIGPILVMLIAEMMGIRSVFTVGLVAYLLAIPLILLTKKSD